MKKSDARIFTRAAELVSSGAHEFSCIAIRYVCREYRSAGRRFDLSDSYYGTMLSHYDVHEVLWKLPHGEDRELRVMLLLMMAAIVEAG